jgi:release factor glutamine methyltransferase
MTPRSFDDWLNSTALPRLEARMLLEHASGRTREWLVSHGAEIAPPAVSQPYSKLIALRAEGRPIAHLVGYREFYGRRFEVSPDVLIPRPETELLVETTLQLAPAKARIIDIGTGSGNIAITLVCERGDLSVVGTDSAPESLAIAHINATSLAPVALQSGRLQWRTGPGWAAVAGDERFDIVVSNPPYIHCADPHLTQGDLRFEPRRALTDENDGLTILRTLIDGAGDHLTEGGRLIVEHGYDQADAVRLLMSRRRYGGVRTLRDLAGCERLTMGMRPAGVRAR